MLKGKVLALDYGTKRIGIASGDLEIGIAFPRDVFENKENVIERIGLLCEEIGVKKIIVGLPLNMSEGHGENKVMKSLKVFVEKLLSVVSKQEIGVELLDERLSSFEASQMTGKSGKSRKENLDAYAAQIILQRYFDKLRA